MDDPGASSKKYEVYAKNFIVIGNRRFWIPSRLTNFLFFKRCKIWTGWAPYNELTPDEWTGILDLLGQNDFRMTVAITACWVDAENNLIPFPQKFPKQAKIIKRGVDKGLIEVANHGLTHCVIGKHLPRLLSSNQKYHREFWHWIERDEHFEHIEKSQEILNDYFKKKVEVLVPPGNVYSDDTLDAADKHGFKVVNCNTANGVYGNIKILGNESIFDFHDRDIVKNGIQWLEQKINLYQGCKSMFVSEI